MGKIGLKSRSSMSFPIFLAVALSSLYVCSLAGDAEIWSRHMQNVLCACHTRLDIAYLGMDDSTLAASAKAALDPQADPLMAPLPDSKPAQHSAAGQHSRVAGQSVHSVASVQAASCQLAGFLDVLETLLTVSYPVAVPIPAHGILMLLTRILSFDDTARQAGKELLQQSPFLQLHVFVSCRQCCMAMCCLLVHLVHTCFQTWLNAKCSRLAHDR